MRTKTIFGIDILLFISILGLTTIGIVFIYSSGISSRGLSTSSEYMKQIIWAGTGIAFMVSLMFINYSRLKTMSWYIYGICILLLIITLIFGQVVNGAKSWLGFFNFGIQPSEFAKIGTILLLSSYLSSNEKRIGSLRQFIVAFGIILLPVLLTVVQPDMGTALVFFPIFLGLIFIAGFPLRYILFVIIAAVFFVLLTVLPAWSAYLAKKNFMFIDLLTNSTFIQIFLLAAGFIILIAFLGYRFFKKDYFYWIMYSISIIFLSFSGSVGARLVLKDYQLMRLIVFLNPEVDPKGAGWNIIQSITAVGSGGFLGKGFLKGTQSHYQYLPQQSTDFIFSIIAEEWGFLGSMLIFLLFVIILFRLVLITLSIKDSFGQFICVGILSMLCFHFFINIGMAMGIMPITGIPLFFLSYGGSSLWTGMISIGIILSIYSNRYRYA
ncbi:MAG: rod shape-determining protein RodA [Spirochaetales bacterium]|nr:MAG: rod shape-determining protein RodA [Spirochaetales bacterium]